jgi:hypothetical protein
MEISSLLGGGLSQTIHILNCEGRGLSPVTTSKLFSSTPLAWGFAPNPKLPTAPACAAIAYPASLPLGRDFPRQPWPRRLAPGIRQPVHAPALRYTQGLKMITPALKGG